MASRNKTTKFYASTNCCHPSQVVRSGVKWIAVSGATVKTVHFSIETYKGVSIGVAREEDESLAHKTCGFRLPLSPPCLAQLVQKQFAQRVAIPTILSFISSTVVSCLMPRHKVSSEKSRRSILSCRKEYSCIYSSLWQILDCCGRELKSTKNY